MAVVRSDLRIRLQRRQPRAHEPAECISERSVGDVLIVPPGVIHGWADIHEHVDYLSFRPSHGVMKNGWVNPTIASK